MAQINEEIWVDRTWEKSGTVTVHIGPDPFQVAVGPETGSMPEIIRDSEGRVVDVRAVPRG